MKKILILAGRYLPGYKDGGPVRTLINLTELLGDEYDFRLAVLDRDHGDTQAYPNIQIGAWNQVGKTKVWYYAPGQMNFSLIRKLAKDMDLVYLCGFYDGYGYKTLMLHRMGLLFGKPVVVAAMGTFSAGALSQKSAKKQVFIKGCKALGLFSKISWSVTSELEARDVKRVIGASAKCMIAEDLPRMSVPGLRAERSDTEPLKVIFLSRLCAHKNLSYAVEVLKQVKAELSFDIYGPIQEPEYWAQCQKALELLPRTIAWRYCGDAPSERVQEIFSNYDLLLLPTKGENYGHVVFEAMSVGCLPVISDQTPWTDLEEKDVGHTIPLDRQNQFVQVVEQYASMTLQQRQRKARNAVAYAERKVAGARKETGYRMIFQLADRVGK